MEANPKVMPEKMRREARAEKIKKKIYKKTETRKSGTSKQPLRDSAQKMKKADLKISLDRPPTLHELEIENARLHKALEKEGRERRLMEEALRKNEQLSRKLTETALRQAQELTLLGIVRSNIASKLDMPTLLRSVVESIVEVYGYTHVSLYLLEKDELLLQHQVGYKNIIERIHIHKGISGQVARTGKPILLEDVSKSPDFLGTIENLQSEITVPLLDNDQVIGTLSVESTNRLTEADLKIMVALSVDVGVAIGRSRLYEDVQKRSQTLSALQESTLAIMGHLGLPNVLQAILSQAAQLINTSHGYIYLTQPDGTLQMTTGMGVYPKYIGLTLESGEGLAGRIWQTAQPLIVNDYIHWEGRSSKFNESSFYAVMGVPLMHGSQVEGVLGLAYLIPGYTFNESDVELLSWFAQLASIAIDNAALYTQVHQELMERKQADERLRAGEERLAAVIEGSQLGYSDWNIQTGEVMRNERWANMLGYTLEEVEKNIAQWENLIHPDDRAKAKQAVQDHLDGKTPFHRDEYRLRTKDGSYRWILDQGRVIEYDPQGRPTRLTATHTDITERKQAEQELQTSEQHFRSIFEQSPIGMGLVDTQSGRFLQVNPRYCEITGRTNDEMLALTYNDITHPDDRNTSSDHNQHMLDGKIRSFNFEKRYIRPDRSVVWVHLTVVALWEKPDDPRINLTMVEDITEQKHAEIALRESEEKYRNLVEHTPAVVYLDNATDISSNFYISPQIEKLLGYSQSAFIEKPTFWHDLVLSEDYERATATIAETLEKGQSIEEYRLIAKDGHVIWVRDTSVLVRDEAGQPKYIQGFLEDITSYKQAGDALRKSKQRLQAFFNQSLDGFFFCDFEEPIEWKHSSNKDETLEYIVTTKRFTDVNDAMLKQYGMDRETFLHLTTKDIFAHDLEQGRRLRRELFDNGNLHLETYERTREGVPVWFEGDYVCLHDSLGCITGFFGIQRDITERKKAESELKRHVQNTVTMYELSQNIHTSLDLDLVYQEIHRAVQNLMPCDAFLIALLNGKNQMIDDVYQWDQAKRWESESHPLGEGLTSYIISTGRHLFVNEWTDEHTQLTHTLQFGDATQDTSSVLAVPLFAMDGSCFGMMTAQAYPPHAYTPEHEQLLITLANQVSKTIENANLFVEVQQELAERNRTEQALRESEERYRTLFDGMLDGVYQSTHDGKFVDVNPAMVQMFGYSSREELLSVDIKKDLYFSPEERHSLFLDTGQEKVDEFRMKRKDGSEIWVEDHGRYVHDKNGNVIYHEGILRDITERRHTEDALKRSEAFTKSIIENEPECVKIVAAGGKLQYMNPAGLAMIEADSLELVLGKSVYPIVVSKDREAFIELTEKVLRGEQGTLQFEVVGLKGTHRWLDTHAVPLYDENGKVTALLGLTRDITERMRAADAVREAEEKYHSIFENAMEGIYQSSPEGCFHTVNPAFASMLGYASPQEMMDSITDIARQLYNETHRRRDFIRQLEEQGSISSFEYQMRHKGGWLIWVSENARLVRDADGGVLYYEGILEDITARKQSEQRIDNQLRQLNALHAIDNAINSNFDLRTTLEVLLREVVAQLRADATSVLLFNKDTHTLDYTAGRGFLSKATQHTKLNVGEGYAGRVILDRRTIHISDLSNTDNKLTEALSRAGENFVAYVGSPLIAKGQVVGVLEIFQRSPLVPDPDWFDFLSMIADQAAIAIDNAQLFENLQHSNFDLTLAYDATIEGWSRALDLRDRETEGHTQRVTNLTIKLAQQMGIPDAEILHIRRGALLHDIGKMGIPDNILHKPDTLTPEEWNIMHQHTNYAYQMLTPIKYLKPALDIPRCHHEKWDGTGYPDGLKGEQIPIAARIFAVVDVWDALTSDRSYRDAWSKEKVIEYIRAESGKHFDPKVVETFLSFILNE